MNNILLATSDLPFEAPLFDKIEIEDYLPAFKFAIDECKQEIDVIADNLEEADFANTIIAMEYSGESLSKLEGLFFNLLEATSSPRMQEIAEELSPMLTELSLYISLNKKLFNRIKTVYDKKEDLGLNTEELRLLEKVYKGFTDGGANLDDDKKALFSQLSEELSLLQLKFSNNVLAATNAFSLDIVDKEDLKGLPDSAVEMAAQTAQEQGKKGWTFSLQYPSFSAFMKYSENRELRHKLYMAQSSKCVGGEFDNTKIIKEIANKRLQLAKLLGYESYADYALCNRMAKSKDRVNGFLSELMEASLDYARKEVLNLTEFAKDKGFEASSLAAWDFSYWAEKQLKEQYDIDEEILRPYFRLENCISAVFDLANRLYGIEFKPIDYLPVYHDDVKVYEVLDENKEHLALFYADFFPRASKRSGAWMTEFRGQFVKNNKDYRPFISIVTNFTKPTSNSPSLITHNEFTTLLHEFGHALHGILSKGTYLSCSGTNVARDFVELPSQIMENWAYQAEYLQSFAKDYRTGEPIPSEYIDRIVSAKNYLSGYYQVRQLQFAILDMAWHLSDISQIEDIVNFEKVLLDKYRTLPFVEGSAISPSFSHIFAGGYAAGYYSYKWAEVLEADAFQLFKERGIFNKEVANSFRKNILERGSSDDEALLYRNFRGKDASISSLLISLGLD